MTNQTGQDFKYVELTEKIIKEVFYIYNTLGHGFLEKVYENALYKKLREGGFAVQQQYPTPVFFENVIVGDYVADIIVENKVVVEVKALEKINAIHEVQLVNYLKATGMEVGLLINFGKKLEIKRKIFSNR